MYAVIQTGGKQYVVTQGETLKVEKLSAEPGAEINLSDVLLIADDNKYHVGKPFLENSNVSVLIKEHGLGEKIHMMKKNRKKGYKLKKGHSQPYTAIQVTNINL